MLCVSFDAFFSPFSLCFAANNILLIIDTTLLDEKWQRAVREWFKYKNNGSNRIAKRLSGSGLKKSIVICECLKDRLFDEAEGQVKYFAQSPFKMYTHC